MAHSSRGISLLYWESHGRHSSPYHYEPGNRKLAWSGEGVGTSLCSLIPCPLSFLLCFQPIRWVFPSRLILWKCPQRPVHSNVLKILNSAMLTLRMNHHTGDNRDRTLALAHTGKLANSEPCHQFLYSLMTMGCSKSRDIYFLASHKHHLKSVPSIWTE